MGFRASGLMFFPGVWLILIRKETLNSHILTLISHFNQLTPKLIPECHITLIMFAVCIFFPKAHLRSLLSPQTCKNTHLEAEGPRCRAWTACIHCSWPSWSPLWLCKRHHFWCESPFSSSWSGGRTAQRTRSGVRPDFRWGSWHQCEGGAKEHNINKTITTDGLL